jgi:hypothetical protein
MSSSKQQTYQATKKELKAINLSTKGNTEVLQKRLAQAKEEQEKKEQEDKAAHEAEQKKQKEEEEKRNQEAEQKKQKEEEEKRNQEVEQKKKRKSENKTLNANKSKIPKLEGQASVKNELGSTIKKESASSSKVKKETGSSSKVKTETTSRKKQKGPRRSSKALIEYDLASLKTLQGIIFDLPSYASCNISYFQQKN